MRLMIHASFIQIYAEKKLSVKYQSYPKSTDILTNLDKNVHMSQPFPVITNKDYMSNMKKKIGVTQNNYPFCSKKINKSKLNSPKSPINGQNVSQLHILVHGL